MTDRKTLDINSQFAEALRLMEETRENVLITGRAGTGKSTLLTHFRETTDKQVVVLAPTGVAAVNVNGQTIHSFFGFHPGITLEKARQTQPKNKELYKKLDAVIIDEISMVRADLLDCVDAFLQKWGPTRHAPFGGVQMIFIGDLYQLPPVVTNDEQQIFTKHYASPYFFASEVMNPRQTQMLHEPFRFTFLELEKIYRQKDAHFIGLLNGIRDNTATGESIKALNTRHTPNFVPNKDDRYITLTTTNAMAREENAQKLSELKNELFRFTASVSGRVPREMHPADEELEIKQGAQIMMLNNDPARRWINGTIGTVVQIKKGSASESAAVSVALETGKTILMEPHQWDIFHFSFDRTAKQIVSENVGTFTQYPMRLAWAVTIHKAQGKTFDRVIVDMGRGAFATGQTYVALSRCTSIEGLVLRRPLRQSDIQIDDNIVTFIAGLR